MLGSLRMSQTASRKERRIPAPTPLTRKKAGWKPALHRISLGRGGNRGRYADCRDSLFHVALLVYMVGWGRRRETDACASVLAGLFGVGVGSRAAGEAMADGLADVPLAFFGEPPEGRGGDSKDNDENGYDDDGCHCTA